MDVVGDASSRALPVSVKVSLYDRYHAVILQRSLAAPSWPGSFLLRALPDNNPAERIAVVAYVGATRFEGWGRVVLHAREQVSTHIQLSATTPDGDGDEVPDAIDNCPQTPNTGQEDQDGDGVGDACAGLDGGVDQPSSVFCQGASQCNYADTVDHDPLCEGFDGTYVNDGGYSMYWYPNKLMGDIHTDATHVCRGGSALRMRIDAATPSNTTLAQLGEDNATFYGLPGGPSPRPKIHFWARAFFFIPEPPVQRFRIMGSAEGMAEANGFYGELELLLSSSQLIARRRLVPKMNLDDVAPLPMPADQFFNHWQCIEWEINEDPTSGYQRVSINDQLVLSTPMENTNPTNSLADFFIGIASVDQDILGPAPAAELWVDEILVDTHQAIGCLR